MNAYLRKVTGEDFTAKDFRTWAATLCAVCTLQEIGAAATMTESKKNLSEAIKRVARQLGNTPTICRKYYIHPAVVSAYGEGRLLAMLCTEAAEIGEDRLHPQERSVMRVLEGATAAQSEAGEDR